MSFMSITEGLQSGSILRRDFFQRARQICRFELQKFGDASSYSFQVAVTRNYHRESSVN